MYLFSFLFVAFCIGIYILCESYRRSIQSFIMVMYNPKKENGTYNIYTQQILSNTRIIPNVYTMFLIEVTQQMNRIEYKCVGTRYRTSYDKSDGPRDWIRYYYNSV